MSLRDYFAAAVDVSVYNPVDAWQTKHGTSECLTISELAASIASIRLIEADAMLKERAKKQEPTE